MDFRDLPPRKDPKGGSPKTPYPPVMASEFPYQPPPPPIHQNGNGGTTWKILSGSLIGLLAGMFVAWVTAIRSQGVSQKEMEDYVRQSQADQEKTQLSRAEMHDYVDRYSPWNFDKTAIINRLASQDQNIGELRAKIDLAAKYLEQQQQKK